MLFNNFLYLLRAGQVCFSCYLMLITVDTAERAGQLGDENGDGIVFRFQYDELEKLMYVIFVN